MLIEGHIKLLKLALRSKPELSNFFASKGNGEMSFERLISGLKYPDLPCASRSLKFDKMGSYDMHVQMNSYNTCNPAILLKYLSSHVGFQKDVLSEAYLSHNYTLAYLHSMTPNPNLTNGQVISNTLQFCRVMASMAIRDILNKDPSHRGLPNVFWMGMLMHTVMDSFSPAHVFRYSHYNEKKSNAIINVMRTVNDMALYSGYKASDLSVDVTINVLGSIAADSLDGKVHIRSDGDILVEFKKRLAATRLPGAILSDDVRKQKQIIDMFKATYMYAMLTKEFRNAENLKIPTGSNAAPGNGIVSFMYYNNQSHTSHLKKDTLMFIKSRHGVPYLDNVVAICAEIMELYATSCKRLIDSQQKRQIQDSFVHATMNLLRTKVFFLHSAELGQVQSGYDLPELKTELLKNAQLA